MKTDNLIAGALQSVSSTQKRVHAFTAPLIIAALCSAGLYLPISASAQNRSNTDRAVSVRDTQTARQGLRDLAEQPEKWIGRRITVEGYVGQVYGPHMFTIHGTGDLSGISIPVIGADPISILYQQPGSPALRTNDRVYVTGDVLYFTRPGVEGRTRARFTNDVYRRYANQPMIVTDEVRNDNPGSGSVIPASSQRGVPDITYLITRPRLADMAGNWARLSDVKVLDLVSDRGFWVGEGTNRRLFAVLAPALDRGEAEHLVQVKPGQTVTLIGVIEKMPPREEILHRWKTIDNREADALAREPVYLLVRSIDFQMP